MSKKKTFKIGKGGRGRQYKTEIFANVFYGWSVKAKGKCNIYCCLYCFNERGAKKL